MFEYIIRMPFPLKPKGKANDLSWTKVVAKYNFDPGLEVNDEVNLSEINCGGWDDEPFSFTAMVVKKTKIVKPQQDGKDIFIVDILVEIADKEEFERMRNILIRQNPGKFED